MIFSFIVAIIVIILSFSGNNFSESIGEVSQTDTKVSQKIKPSKIITKEPVWESKILYPLNQDEFFDLNQDGKLEKITIYSTLGKEIGDENTKIYINNSKEAVLNLGGYFDGIQLHKLNPQGQQVLEVRTIGGHSVDTTFYTYKNNNLTMISVSTAKPPSFFGIISRNRPELKDVNNDGTLELLAYYNFVHDSIRKVEVYTFNGQAFNKTQEYEEVISDQYL